MRLTWLTMRANCSHTRSSRLTIFVAARGQVCKELHVVDPLAVDARELLG